MSFCKLRSNKDDAKHLVEIFIDQVNAIIYQIYKMRVHFRGLFNPDFEPSLGCKLV